MSYKYCIVPMCKNNTETTPDKRFLNLPRVSELRKKWLSAMGRDKVNYYDTFCCEDHFDIENDAANFIEYKMCFTKKLLLKDGVLPSRFECQKINRKRPCDASSTNLTDVGIMIKEEDKSSIRVQVANEKDFCGTFPVKVEEMDITEQFVDSNAIYSNDAFEIKTENVDDYSCSSKITNKKIEFRTIKVEEEHEQAESSSMCRDISEDPLELKIHKCHLCEYLTDEPLDLCKHKLELHRQVEDSQLSLLLVKCQLCEYSSQRTDNLKRHMEEIHPNALKKTKTKCIFCNYAVDQDIKLGRHLRSKHKCYLCTYIGNNLDLMKHQNSNHFNLSYECKFCEFVGSNQEEKDRHTNNTHKCHLCEYVGRFQIKKHLEHVHSINEFITCSYCEYVATHEGAVKMHIESTHTCPLCDYIGCENIKKHIGTVHFPSEQKYECNFCDYVGSHKHYLNRHISSAHPNLEQFKCPHCDYLGSQNVQITEHVRDVHSCPFCDYVGKDNIKKHIAFTHTKKVLYRCGFCDYLGSNKGYLNRHVTSAHPNLQKKMKKC